MLYSLLNYIENSLVLYKYSRKFLLLHCHVNLYLQMEFASLFEISEKPLLVLIFRFQTLRLLENYSRFKY